MLERYRKPQLKAALFDEAIPGGSGGDARKFDLDKTRLDWQALVENRFVFNFRGKVLRNNANGTEAAVYIFQFPIYSRNTYINKQEYQLEFDEDRNNALLLLGCAQGAGYTLIPPPLHVQTALLHIETYKPLSHLYLLFEQTNDAMHEIPTDQKEKWNKELANAQMHFYTPKIIPPNNQCIIDYTNPLPGICELYNYHEVPMGRINDQETTALEKWRKQQNNNQ